MGIRPEKDCRACARGQSRDKKKGWSYEPYNINGTAPFSACAGMVLQNLQNGGDTEDKIYDAQERYRFLQRLTQRANRAGRIHIECCGHENLPEKDGFVVFPNHQGLFDGLIFLETLDRPFSIVMKKEVENVILIRQVREIIHGKLMDREDIRQSMGVIREMSREVKEGRNYIIFAEGTRSRNGNELLEFKGGAFKSATNAHCPIVPAAIIDSYKAFDTNSIKPLTVQVHYLKPIEYEEYKGMRSHEIALMVQERIRSAIRQAQGGSGAEYGAVSRDGAGPDDGGGGNDV